MLEDHERATGTLTVLGCDGSYPGPGGAGSGYLVRQGPTTLWCDAGPGTFANLQALDDPAAVDAIVCTHEHPDHWSDLESYAVWARLAGRGPVPVYAPPGLRARSYFGDDERLVWHEVAPGERFVVGALRVTTARTDHGPPTLGLRIEAAGTADPACALVYSADTGPGFALGALGEGIGLVVCEATYTAADEGRLRHLSGRQAGALAAEARARALVLTHRWPTVSAADVGHEAEATFGRPVAHAAIGRVFRWGSPDGDEHDDHDDHDEEER